jgi:prefoldin subunit 5
LGIPAAAVTVMTLILSQGNFIAAIGAGIGTAVSVYATNYRLIAKVKFLEEKLEDLIRELELLRKALESSNEPTRSLDDDLESLQKKLKD